MQCLGWCHLDVPGSAGKRFGSVGYFTPNIPRVISRWNKLLSRSPLILTSFPGHPSIFHDLSKNPAMPGFWEPWSSTESLWRSSLHEKRCVTPTRQRTKGCWFLGVPRNGVSSIWMLGHKSLQDYIPCNANFHEPCFVAFEGACPSVWGKKRKGQKRKGKKRMIGRKRTIQHCSRCRHILKSIQRDAGVVKRHPEASSGSATQLTTSMTPVNAQIIMVVLAKTNNICSYSLAILHVHTYSHMHTYIPTYIHSYIRTYIDILSPSRIPTAPW